MWQAGSEDRMTTIRRDSSSASGRRRRILLLAALWLLFAAGLAMQAFSPHLAIEHGSFVIPESANASGAAIDPRELVQRQRFMQAISAALVVAAVIGLGICYREVLSRSLSRT
jgi:hypothetical protein